MGEHFAAVTRFCRSHLLFAVGTADGLAERAIRSSCLGIDAVRLHGRAKYLQTIVLGFASVVVLRWRGQFPGRGWSLTSRPTLRCWQGRRGRTARTICVIGSGRRRPVPKSSPCHGGARFDRIPWRGQSVGFRAGRDDPGRKDHVGHLWRFLLAAQFVHCESTTSRLCPEVGHCNDQINGSLLSLRTRRTKWDLLCRMPGILYNFSRNSRS